jgi:hypothetical protein
VPPGNGPPKERSTMNEQQVRDYESLPKARSCRLIDFEEAEVRTLESFPPQYVLVVRGIKPYLNMRVRLEPLIYIRQPEYWGIEVVGRIRGGIGLPTTAPYTVSIPLAGILGTEGIEVIGATRSERIEVPPDETKPECGEWSAWHNLEPGSPPTLIVVGQCTFPTAGYKVELRRHEPQGFNPKDLLLDLIVHEPTGPVPQVITTVEARYEEETDFEYDSVTILPEGPSIRVEKVS